MQRSILSTLLVVLILGFGFVQGSHVHGASGDGPSAVDEQQVTLTPVTSASFCLICTLSVGFLATPAPHSVETSLTSRDCCSVLQDGELDNTTVLLLLLRGPPPSLRLA